MSSSHIPSNSEVGRSVTNRRVLLGSLSGSAIEWYDFLLYATAAPLVFNSQFFPNDDPFVAIMLAYLGNALTFVIRPFGGIVFAHIGDRIGRKRTLVLTLSIMGAGTVAIGLLPTYAQIGVLAPALLYFFRIVQGLAIGGEWGGALLLAYEYAPPQRRGFFGSVPQLGVPLGLVLGNLAMALATQLPGDAFDAWGWRIPFILSIVLVGIGLWIRHGLDETPAFRKMQQSGAVEKLPLGTTLRDHWRAVLVGALVACVAIPLCGAVSDRFGRRPIFLVGVVALAVATFAYFALLDQRSLPLFFLASALALGVAWSPVTATLGTMMSETFPANVRYSGITLGYQIGAAVFSGTAPMVAEALVQAYDGAWLPVAIYIAVLAAISFVAAVLARRLAVPAEETGAS